MILIAEMSLRVALLMAAWVGIASYAGAATRRAELVASGERGVHAILALLMLASTGLGIALFTSDFSLRYVASHTSTNLPGVYAAAAFWAGRPGTLLLCALILAGYSAAALRGRQRCPTPYATGTLGILMLCLLAAIVLMADPWERSEWPLPDGRGMNPLLQSPGMLIHAPIMYLGYVATAIPLALAASALIERRLTGAVVHRIWRWSLAAWFLTTVGILIGMRWAYVEPHWGVHWALNPLTSAALLPWLANTALLWSLMAQARRGVMRAGNVILVIAAFLLAVLSLAVSGSGTLSGADLGADSRVGLLLMGSLVVAMILAGPLVVARLRDVAILTDTSGFRAPDGRRGKYGVHAVALGIALLAAGLVGQGRGSRHDLTLHPGEAVTITDPYGRGWRFVSESLSRYDILNRQVTALTLSAYRGDSDATLLTSELRQYVDSRGAPTFEPSPELGLVQTPAQDVYVLLSRVLRDDAVELRIGFVPLAWLVWLGGAIVAFGGLVTLWPQRAMAESAVSGARDGE